MQTLEEAWQDRMADPWTQKTLKQSSGSDSSAKPPPQPLDVFYVGASQPVEQPCVTAATLAALRDFTCHPSGKAEVNCRHCVLRCKTVYLRPLMECV